jgi:hypothetical protein
VFVDETGSNLAMTRRYARSQRGSRAYNHARVRDNSLIKKNIRIIEANKFWKF